MKERLLEWLVCPSCRGELFLKVEDADNGDVWTGELCCGKCSARYPVVRGIPRLIPATIDRAATLAAHRFSYEWARFDEIRPEYRAQFRGWIAPVGPEAFVGRRVLDAGCGKGRHLRLAADFGATEVIGIDLGPAVEVAARNTADLSNVHVIQADLTQAPLRASSIDLVCAIGVLPHLSAPVAGFRALAALLAPRGLFVAWLLAREGNGWVLTLIDPLRRVTCRLPLALVSGVAWALTVPLWIALQGIYRPARSRPRLRRLLPYESYLSDLVEFPFREVHSIAFDMLLPPIAHYMSRADVERCFAESGLTIRSLRWHHGNSWSAAGWRREAR